MADQVLLKIQRANKHISELQEIIATFRQREPYRIRKRRDSNTGEHIIYLDSADEMPREIPLVLGDIVHNLYAALDYLACELVITGGGEVCTASAFPISEGVPMSRDQKARYDRQVKGMREEVRQLIRTLNPYRGTNNSLWRLQKLNNISKHRNLIAVHATPSGLTSLGELAAKGFLCRGPLHNGSNIAMFPADTEGHENVQVSIDIAIHEPQADISLWPAVTASRLFYNTVYRTVQKFDIYR